MANKHLKKPDTSPKPEKARHAKPARHAKAESPAKPPKTKTKKAGGKRAKGGKPDEAAASAQEQVISLTDTLTAQVEASLNKSRTAVPAPEPEKSAPEQKKPEEPEKPAKQKPVNFRRDKAKPAPGEKKPLLSHRDRVGAVISLIAAVVLLAATAVVWVYRDSFSPDGMILSADTAAVAREEYVFDAGSGEAFAAAGKGLAVANVSGFEPSPAWSCRWKIPRPPGATITRCFTILADGVWPPPGSTGPCRR